MKNDAVPPFENIRDVQDFERVSLRVQNIQNDLVLKQGERESLVLEGDPALLSRITTTVRAGELGIGLTGSWSDLIAEALATSLTRQRVQYILTVRQLSALDITGLASISAAGLETARLALRFNGPGQARFTAFQARTLEVELSGPCKIEFSGKAAEQKIAVRALGFYYAPQLESRKAAVRLSGPGQATLWVSDELDAAISGPGRLEYYGAPRVRYSGTPFGGLVSLGSR